jgi:hypothetical protein
VPIAILVVVRMVRALVATARLLTDWELLRTMPWWYIRRLPFRRPWIGVAAASLALALVAAVVTVAAPDHGVRWQAYNVGLLAALVGIFSSWARYLIRWARLRGRL